MLVIFSGMLVILFWYVGRIFWYVASVSWSADDSYPYVFAVIEFSCMLKKAKTDLP